MQNKFNSKSGWNILKILGAILIALCPLIVGFKKSNNLKQNQIKIEKIIELINWIISEIKFKKTEISSMFFNISKNKNFKNLEFLQNLKKNLKIYPFPKAWETSIENWEEFMPSALKQVILLNAELPENFYIMSASHLTLLINNLAKSSNELSYTLIKNFCNNTFSNSIPQTSFIYNLL